MISFKGIPLKVPCILFINAPPSPVDSACYPGFTVFFGKPNVPLQFASCTVIAMVRWQICGAAKLEIHVVHRRGFWMPRLHLSGDSGIRLSPALVASYAGVYELAPGRDIVVTVTGDLVFVQGLNEPKLPLLVQSETQFMSTATPTGFEFAKDAQARSRISSNTSEFDC